MQQQLDVLQNNAKVLTQIDQLLAAKDYTEYKKNYMKLITYLAENGHKSGAYETLDALFDNFYFNTAPQDPRTIQLNKLCTELNVNIKSPTLFFHLLQTTFKKIGALKNPAVMARTYMRQLISAHQTDIQKRIASLSEQIKSQPTQTADVSQALVVAHSQLWQACAKYGVPTAVFTVGASFTTLSALVQFSPKLALHIGLQLSPTALITLTTFGAALIFYSIYSAYQANKQAPPTPPATAEAQASTPCKTLMSQYLSYCFNYGGTKKPKVTIALDPKIIDGVTLNTGR